ncbi:HIRAN domain-containing protein [Myxococcota bacterium]|nr:HIRAN domain-containing protein [Myxococcota bacterium]
MTRSLFVAVRAQEDGNHQWQPVGLLENPKKGEYRFRYTEGANRLPGFSGFTGMEDLNQVYLSERLFPIFSNRIFSPRRPEFGELLEWSGFSPGEKVEPMALLEVTEGLRATDSVEVFPKPREAKPGVFVSRFFLHGLRWMPPAAIAFTETLVPGTRLGLMLDMANPYDPNAVAVRSDYSGDRFWIGYVPRYLAAEIRKLCQDQKWVSGLTLLVQKVNPQAPLHNRILCELTAPYPHGIRPCEGEEFKPLVAVDE